MSGIKGLRSQDAKDLVDFVRAAGVATIEALRAKFGDRAAATGNTATRWLATKLVRLEDSGYIERCLGGWCVAASAPQEPEVVEQELVFECQVAQPRRISMLVGQYTPPAQVHRPGALDHANKPSLINGVPHRYRSAW